MSSYYSIIWLNFCIASCCLCSSDFQMTPFYRIDDMMFKNNSLVNQNTRFNANLNYPQLWPYGIVYYEISHRLRHQTHLIEDAMRQIMEQIPCIIFLQRFEEANYVYIDNYETGECLSYVGMIGGRQELYLGHSCFKIGIILHELMHALGFYHEHCRPDRDDYLYILYENIKSGKEKNFIKMSTKEYKTVTEFDYNSIMIYGETAFSRNHLPTMIPVDYHYTISNPATKSELSLSDIRALSIYYKC